MNRRQVLGAAVAVTAATLFLGQAGLADEKKAEMKKGGAKTYKCVGGNACKGHGACASADGKTSCAGKNECKGKGWVMTKDEAECNAMKAKNAEKKS